MLVELIKNQVVILKSDYIKFTWLIVILQLTNLCYSQVGGIDCSNAVNINVNSCSASSIFPNTGAVGSPANICNGSGALIKAERWYSFTTPSSPATAPTTITLSGSSQSTTQRNLAFELYQGSTCPGSYLACAETGILTETMVQTLAASTTYFIRVANVCTGAAQLVSTTIVCVKQPPVNDMVDGAIPLAVNNSTCLYTVYTSTTASASNGSGSDCWPVPPCATYGGTSTDVWFSVPVPTSGNFFLQTKGLSASQNYAMAVYSSSVCSSASVLGCSNANPSGVTGGAVSGMEMPTLYVSGATPSSTVYVRIWNETGTPGTFSICANDMGPCGNLPTNDFCSNPIAINTGGATGDIAYNNTVPIYTTDLPGNLVVTANQGCLVPALNSWYSFIATAGNLSIPFSVGAAPCASTISATVYNVSTTVNGCCKDFTKINTNTCTPTSNTGSGPGGTFTLTVPSASLVPGQVYYLMVNTGATNPACSFSITGWSVAGTLPVEFVNFKGTNEGKHNLLEWVTAAEKNIMSYTLQHSPDATDFTTVVTHNAKNMPGEAKYTVYDEDPFENVTYYRVKQTDMNGVEKYTNTISVSLRNLYDNIYNIHPNPTTNNLNFEFYSKSQGSINVELTGCTGNVVLNMRSALDEGKNLVTLPMSELDNGVYILKVVSERSGKTTHHKIIKN
ncbi:MAG: T9SS type A sorting domain-containing protein [Bacteroidota bacterium]